jgi:hypothetical protein
MWRFFKARHLRYHSIEEWMDREHITTLTHPDDPALQDRLFQQLGELRKHLWEQHIVHLTPEERQQLEAGQHPSQSHSRMDQAEPIFDEFRSQVASLPYVTQVHLGAYDMDRVIFQVIVSQEADWRTWQKDIPPFYRGFEVKIGKLPPNNLLQASATAPAS